MPSNSRMDPYSPIWAQPDRREFRSLVTQGPLRTASAGWPGTGPRSHNTHHKIPPPFLNLCTFPTIPILPMWTLPLSPPERGVCVCRTYDLEGRGTCRSSLAAACRASPQLSLFSGGSFPEWPLVSRHINTLPGHPGRLPLSPRMADT